MREIRSWTSSKGKSPSSSDERQVLLKRLYDPELRRLIEQIRQEPGQHRRHTK
jgi:hypothetical protein